MQHISDKSADSVHKIAPTGILFWTAASSVAPIIILDCARLRIFAEFARAPSVFSVLAAEMCSFLCLHTGKAALVMFWLID